MHRGPFPSKFHAVFIYPVLDVLEWEVWPPGHRLGLFKGQTADKGVFGMPLSSFRLFDMITLINSLISSIYCRAEVSRSWSGRAFRAPRPLLSSLRWHRPCPRVSNGAGATIKYIRCQPICAWALRPPPATRASAWSSCLATRPTLRCSSRTMLPPESSPCPLGTVWGPCARTQAPLPTAASRRSAVILIATLRLTLPHARWI